MAAQIDIRTARRIALAAQGFGKSRPTGSVDVRHFRGVISSVGLLQLDSVNVLERSHYLSVFSRLGSYDRPGLDRYTARSGELFEYWGHAASLLPTEDYPLFGWRMETMRPWPRIKKLEQERPGYIDEVEREVRDRGPLTVSDLDDGGTRTGPWWGYGQGKIALEWLFARGRITARRGAQFIRVYDLTERVIPERIFRAKPLDKEEAYRELLLRGARHHGIGTAADLADYYRLNVPEAKPILVDLVAEGLLVEVQVDGWRNLAYLHPDAVRPRRSRGTALLSPFDSLVWARDRTERLFGFHYRIEIYVPRPERVYGYYVLPFLLDGELVGRVDLKAHRDRSVLEVRSAFHEDDVDVPRVAAALAPEVALITEWLGLDDVRFARKGNLMAALRDAA